MQAKLGCAILLSLFSNVPKIVYSRIPKKAKSGKLFDKLIQQYITSFIWEYIFKRAMLAI